MTNIFIRTAIAPYRVDTYNALAKMGFSMYFYSDRDPDIANMDALLELCEFKPTYLKGKQLGRRSRTICFGLWGIIKREKPKVIIVPEFQIVLWQILILKWLTCSKFKIISMCDDSYDMIANDNDFSRVHKWLRRLVPRLVDDIILLDVKAKDWYQEHFQKGIWMPILRNDDLESDKYRKVLPRSIEIAAHYGLSTTKVILFVGRLVKVKNVSGIIAAYARMTEHCKLVIIGDGEAMNDLHALASSISKEVLFLGRIEGEELRAWYNIADVFVLLSTLEPYGAVINEALLAGNRIVISQKAGASCLVSEDNGEIVDPYNIVEAANALDRQVRMAGDKKEIRFRPSLMKVSFQERMNYLMQRLQRIQLGL